MLSKCLVSRFNWVISEWIWNHFFQRVKPCVKLCNTFALHYSPGDSRPGNGFSLCLAWDKSCAKSLQGRCRYIVINSFPLNGSCVQNSLWGLGRSVHGGWKGGEHPLKALFCGRSIKTIVTRRLCAACKLSWVRNTGEMSTFCSHQLEFIEKVSFSITRHPASFDNCDELCLIRHDFLAPSLKPPKFISHL